MIYRLILAPWASEEFPTRRKILEGQFTADELADHNLEFYNIHHLPNYPSHYTPGTSVDGSQIDTWQWVFVDMDLKDGHYASKEAFIAALHLNPLKPSRIVDSGGGIHAYWEVSDLDAKAYLRLQKRLIRYFNTDSSLATLYQLMRPAGYINVKRKGDFRRVVELEDTKQVFTCEDLDKWLPPITHEDEQACSDHYDRTMHPAQITAEIDEMPQRWFKFAKKGTEAYRLFYGEVQDRSKADYRLAHLMNADGFTRDDALAVLANGSKASERSTQHRFNYANNILEKIWVAIERGERLGYSVEELLAEADDDEFEGTPFRCNELFDATECGFRLTHVLGLVGGAGSGKTAVSLNYFYHFVTNNPTYYHVVFSLEQPKKEIAKRWRKLVGANSAANKRVIIVDNYNSDGTYRHLTLGQCEDYVAELQDAKMSVGCVMIDHIGLLKQENKNGEREGLIDICTKMKSFAVNRNVMLIMQSQTSREKAKAGDVELDKDAAYGTTSFEWFVDWLVTIWQPLKRIYQEAPHMTVTCVKYCKIRHKHPKDKIIEDVRYAFKFDAETGLLRRLNAAEKTAYSLWSQRATAERNKDKSETPGEVTDAAWVKQGEVTNETGTESAADTERSARVAKLLSKTGPNNTRY